MRSSSTIITTDVKRKFREIRRTITVRILLYKALHKDPRTPRIAKIFLWLAIAYFALPFDLIPDAIPVLGQLDDIVIVPLLLWFAIRCIPEELYREHETKLR